MKYFKKSAIIIPSIYLKSSVCDVVHQTAQELNRYSLVVIIQVREGKSIKEILSGDSFNLFQKINDVLYFTPIDILPFKRINRVKQINIVINIVLLQLYLLLIGRYSLIIWNFFPQIEKINSLFFIKKIVIFDIVDYFTVSQQSSQKSLITKKASLLKRADKIFAISNILRKSYQRIYSKKITLVPQGFDLDGFVKNAQKKPMKKPSKPVIGFIGGINERLDFELINKVIKNNKKLSFVFCGPIAENENITNPTFALRIRTLLQHTNVVHIPRKKRSNLLPIINDFDICIIPYDVTLPFNQKSYPMKIFEYFYAGKPTISTPISELKSPRFKELIYIGKNEKEWQEHIDSVLSAPWPKSKIEKQKKMALENTWSNKINLIMQEIIKDTKTT